MTSRVAVLASGRGSNLRSLLEHLERQGLSAPAQVILVLSDHPDAGALSLAKEFSSGIATITIQAGSDHGAAVVDLLQTHAIDLIVLAGFLKLVPGQVVTAYRGRIINVHPALLPSFGGQGMYGARVHRAVLGSGARVSGATVHFVDDSYDRGAIIAQWPVPVFEDDTEKTLAARVLRAEHALLPRVVCELAKSRVRLQGDHATGFFASGNEDAAFTLHERAPGELGSDIDAALAR
ncbi:MAG: phosphoribosylglycinamide formyltransferase [Gemmatimonadaceae bacterium]